MRRAKHFFIHSTDTGEFMSVFDVSVDAAGPCALRLARWFEPGRQPANRGPELLVEDPPAGNTVLRLVQVIAVSYGPRGTEVVAKVLREDPGLRRSA